MPPPETDPARIRAALARGEVRRVLAVRAARLGDTLHVLPALALLRGALPEAELTFLCAATARPVARAAPVDRVVAYPHKGRGPGPWLARRRAVRELGAPGAPDLVLGLEDKPWGRRLAARLGARFRHAAAEGGAHVVERKAAVLRPLGLWESGRPPPIRWAPAPGAAERVSPLLAGLPAPRVGLQVGSHGAGGLLRPRRRRDPSPGWLRATARALHAALGAGLLVHGGRGGREGRTARALARDLAGDGLPVAVAEGLDVDGLGAALAGLDALVSANTGPAHLAAAVGTPVVLLHGPSTPRALPWRAEGLAVLARGLACSPCRGTVHGRLCRVPRCLDELAPGDVADAVAGLVAAP